MDSIVLVGKGLDYVESLQEAKPDYATEWVTQSKLEMFTHIQIYYVKVGHCNGSTDGFYWHLYICTLGANDSWEVKSKLHSNCSVWVNYSPSIFCSHIFGWFECLNNQLGIS